MKSHLEFLREVLEESGTRCNASTNRDLETITVRAEHEGFSFLTITLPAFCADFQKSLAEGQVGSHYFEGFSKNGCLPKLFSGFTNRVFCSVTGKLLDEPCVASIRAVRQICLLYSKVNLPCSDTRKADAMQNFIKCEQEVKRYDSIRTEAQKQQFRYVSDLLFRDVLYEVDRKIYDGEIVPKHGPGSTCEGISGNAKYLSMDWTDRLESLFYSGEFLFPNWRYFSVQDVHFLDPGAERPVRVISVPKTLKTPRIIAIEPVCMQYVQQGILEILVPLIESNNFLNGMIGFNDQTPNQRLAQEGSLSGDLATLDLSEASDRVSNQLVRDLLATHTISRDAVDACRSRRADVPGHGVIRLAKFASMGSALCFPFEAMVFLTIVMIGLHEAYALPVTRKSISSFSDRVRIYGDDIIVPTDAALCVVSALETFGFKVNTGKSFWTGKFRESCGKEYYDGQDVSIVKVREMFPTRRTHASEIISTVSLRNLFWKEGYVRPCEYLEKLVKVFIPLPNIHETSPCLGMHSFVYDVDKQCNELHHPLVKGAVVNARLPSDILDGPGALLKWFLKRSDEPFASRDHLERAGRPESVSLKLRWVRPY